MSNIHDHNHTDRLPWELMEMISLSSDSSLLDRCQLRLVNKNWNHACNQPNGKARDHFIVLRARMGKEGKDYESIFDQHKDKIEALIKEVVGTPRQTDSNQDSVDKLFKVLMKLCRKCIRDAADKTNLAYLAQAPGSVKDKLFRASLGQPDEQLVKKYAETFSKELGLEPVPASVPASPHPGRRPRPPRG